ncbi:hypothetical protein PCANC_20869 [Puccinia coronata f. sp. avenae]|uniref:Uncharacterized protein n=1 Tax=Puccinia coronata f. sp. avenae TaxID=200324 RepID=A0A2N5SS65_9BASI|nr:hypothetical protein PCASD_20490 [Puccinia coronata f. sp. avenae]PLW29740.1 hypothetical protein PCANC_20869 [Puccinia coronata f. sp. avenae]PLW33820.1 hypothetical protein PCASD_15874 [Puccinia coronata f. sp. avenae]
MTDHATSFEPTCLFGHLGFLRFSTYPTDLCGIFQMSVERKSWLKFLTQALQWEEVAKALRAIEAEA